MLLSLKLKTKVYFHRLKFLFNFKKLNHSSQAVLSCAVLYPEHLSKRYFSSMNALKFSLRLMISSHLERCRNGCNDDFTALFSLQYGKLIHVF